MKLFVALTFCLTLFCATTQSYAQQIVMLKGKITDNATNSPCQLEFRDETGALTRAKSGSDGSYQTILKSGHTYALTIVDDGLKRFSFSYEIPLAAKYSEIVKDFSIAPVQTATAAPATTKSKKKTKTKKSTKGK